MSDPARDPKKSFSAAHYTRSVGETDLGCSAARVLLRPLSDEVVGCENRSKES